MDVVSRNARKVVNAVCVYVNVKMKAARSRPVSKVGWVLCFNFDFCVTCSAVVEATFSGCGLQLRSRWGCNSGHVMITWCNSGGHGNSTNPRSFPSQIVKSIMNVTSQIFCACLGKYGWRAWGMPPMRQLARLETSRRGNSIVGAMMQFTSTSRRIKRRWWWVNL